MMRVRVRVPFVDTKYGLCKVGTEMEMDDHHAVSLIRGKIVDPIVPDADGNPTDPRWEFRISPTRYLERFPNGPSADLARKVLAS